MPAVDPDLPLRQAAVARARELAETYDDLVPLARLREGFVFEGQPVASGHSSAEAIAAAVSVDPPR